MSNFKTGPEQKKEKARYADVEREYVNKGFVLDFFHIPSGKSVQFKAMLTRFEDKYVSNWKQDQVYGRNDPIQTFQGTIRVLSLAWDVVAASVGEAKDNLQKISLLIAMLYPSYNSTGGNVSTISAAPLFKVSFVNLIKNYSNTTSKRSIASNKQGNGKANAGGLAQVAGLVGSISGLTYAPSLEAGFFDPPEEAGNLYPQTVNLSFDYAILHTHTVGWFGSDFSPSAGSYPYGRPTDGVGGEDRNKVMNETKTGGTDEINTAMQKRIIEV